MGIVINSTPEKDVAICIETGCGTYQFDDLECYEFDDLEVYDFDS